MLKVNILQFICQPISRTLILIILITNFHAVLAETWKATASNTQEGWIWWHSGQAHWSNNPNNRITIPNISRVTQVNFSTPCPEAQFTLRNNTIHFIGIPSHCAIESIGYETSTSTDNSNTLPIAGEPPLINNPGDKRYMYNGNSRIRITNTHGTALDIGEGDFSISFNIRTTVSSLTAPCSIDAINNGNMIFDRNRLNEDGSSIEISIVSGTIAARFDNIAFCGNRLIADGASHAVRVERKGNRAIITVDGITDRVISVYPSDLRCRQPSTSGDCDIALFHEKWLFSSANHFFGDINGLEITSQGQRVF